MILLDKLQSEEYMLLKSFRKKTVLVIIILSSIVMYPANFAMVKNDLIREGTQLAFEVIGREEGISNLSVSSIIQDVNGFIWFGTQGGLNRYDGRGFKIYSNDPFNSNSLLHNLIQTLFYDSQKNQIWIGTYQGISRFDIDTETFTNYTVELNGLSNPVVVAIEQDELGNLWVGTLDGLNRLNPETGENTVYDVPGNVIRDIYLDSTGVMWLGSYAGLLYFDFDEMKVKASDYKLPGLSVMTIAEKTPGMLTLGIWDEGIVRLELKSGKQYVNHFSDDRIYSYAITSDMTEWIGTWGGGLNAITAEGERYHFESNGKLGGLSHNIVYSLFQDDTGMLWIGTNGGGVCKVNPLKRNYVQYAHDAEDPNTIDQGKINSILRDPLDNLWVAVYNEGLNRIDTDGIVHKYKLDPDVPGTLTDTNIVDMMLDGKGRLLITVGDEIMQYLPETDSFSTLVALPNGVISYAMELVDDQYLWVGTHSDGLFKIDLSNGHYTHYRYDDPEHYISDNLIYDIKLDHRGRLWVATNNGLNYMSKDVDRFEVIKAEKGNIGHLASNTIHVIFEDSEDRLWFGLVGGGITQYREDGTFRTFLEHDGMPSNVVLGILEGSDRRLWASTQNGLAILSPETGDIFALTPDDGIGGYEFNSGQFADADGKMYFGGQHGITVIPGNITEGDLKPPRVYITDVEVLQTPYDNKKEHFNGMHLDLEQDETLLGFKFIALDFDSPEKVVFTYRMVGFDTGWIYSGTVDYITYSKLPPGEYTLEVFAETARGVTSDVVSMSLSIATPWYNTTFAYMGYIALITLVVYGVFKLWQGRVIRKRNDELAQLNTMLNVANQQLEALSTKDPLTGVYNRRYFMTRLEEEMQLAIRSEIMISLIMVDVDNFKEINDRFGHHYGDQYLEQLGELLMRILKRSTDFVVRYGGDEFLLVLFDTESDGAKQIAQKIKKETQELRIYDPRKSAVIETTCSIGVFSFIPTAGTMTKQVTKLVDEALYLAKRGGKNRIVVHEKMDETVDENNEIELV